MKHHTNCDEVETGLNSYTVSEIPEQKSCESLVDPWAHVYDERNRTNISGKKKYIFNFLLSLIVLIK